MNTKEMFNDIREGSFGDIGASGTLDGMCEDYIPSWDWELVNNQLDELVYRDTWDYEE